MKKILSILTVGFLMLSPVAFAQAQEEPVAPNPDASAVDTSSESGIQPMDETRTEEPMDTDADATTTTYEANATYDADSDAQLPQTASPLPLFTLLGALAAVGAVSLRVLRRQ